jgi:hypothetical protein
MGDQSTAACPHCGTANQNFSSFCESCGKALPSGAQSGPRMVTEAMPSTFAGRQLVSEELKKNLKKAKNALLTVAIIQTLFGLLIFGVAKSNMPAGQSFPPVLLITLFGIALIFFGLYAWARHHPLPAAIVGLTLFVTLHLIDAIADPSQLGRGIIMKIIIVAMLIQAIQAGIKYKRLLPQLQMA